MGKILIIAFITLALILWIWAILDITKSSFKQDRMKYIWLAFVILFPILGSIIYFQFRRKITNRVSRKFQPDFK
jgi:hypothetical protein